MNPEIVQLVSLFDDTDEIVTEAVNRRVLDLGPEVLGSIMYLARKEPDIEKRNRIKSRHEFFRAVFRLSDIEVFAHSDEFSKSNLYEGMRLITALLDTNFSERTFEFNYTFLSSYVTYDFRDTKITSKRTAVENVEIFNYTFFNPLKMSLTDPMLNNEKCGLLSSIMKEERRKGNPIAVSTLYLMLAQDAGLNFKILTFPGGFVPAYVEDGKALFYVDIFKNGEIFFDDNLLEFVDGQGLEFDRSQCVIRELSVIYTMYLESMLFVYSNMGSMSKSLMTERALESFGHERFLTIDDDDLE